ncbi:hypothetical protein A0H81_09382 [Grifola frondosa]|uniref:Uncharacterized protein n=1 Tax=Grifola frondosa TaxID=5627 RepID=A0A1C7M3F1_GRIFR|nr:hypothetical protein A0H81_09382 [Grifola frondosa]
MYLVHEDVVDTLMRSSRISTDSPDDWELSPERLNIERDSQETYAQIAPIFETSSRTHLYRGSQLTHNLVSIEL